MVDLQSPRVSKLLSGQCLHQHHFAKLDGRPAVSKSLQTAFWAMSSSTSFCQAGWSTCSLQESPNCFLGNVFINIILPSWMVDLQSPRVSKLLSGQCLHQHHFAKLDGRPAVSKSLQTAFWAMSSS